MSSSETVQTDVESKTDKQHPLLMKVLYSLAAILFWGSLYLYVPTLPTYIQTKTVSLAMVGVVTAQYGLWQAIVRLPVGILADWWGRHKVLIIAGFCLSGLGALILGIAGGAGGLILGRGVTGLAAATWVLLVVAFSNLFPPEEAVRASAILSLIAAAGRVAATSLTGLFNQIGGFSLAFFLAAGLAGLAILFVFPTRERRASPQPVSLEGVTRLITRRDVLLPALLAAAAQHVNWGTTFGFIPILVERMGGTDITQSILVSMQIGVVMVGHLLTTTVEKHVGGRWLVYFAFGLLVIGLGITAFAPTIGWIFAAQFCFGLSLGISYPVLMGKSIENVSEGRRSTAMGLHQAVYAIGMFSGPGISGVLADAIGIQPMFLVTAVAFLPVLFVVRYLSPSKS